jgi:hypothetical protein
MRPLCVVACVTAFVTVAATASAQEVVPAFRRVRSEKPALAALIGEGISRSKTFAGLVASIDRTDGLVYVGEGTCGGRVRACLAMAVSVAGPNRILRIQVDSRRPRRDLIAAIGHELRHAIEVLNEPGIRNRDALFHFYLREAPTARETFETPAAVRAGIAVFAELGDGK